MSLRHVALAVLMMAVTYPSRALPLLAPGIERLPRWALDYLRLVGPAILAALAVVNAVVVTGDDGASIEVGIIAAGVAVCALVVARTRQLIVGLAVAVALVALARAAGLS
jgi:branched-subunit amino acid transport protein